MTFLNDAFNYTLRMPPNEQEAFVTFCALNVIRAGIKKKIVSNEKGYGIVKSYIGKLATYALEHPELKLIDKMYVDTGCKPNCVFFICMGAQFRYHSIAINETLKAFCSSSKNQPIAFDGIRKQPIAEEMYRLANEIVANNVTDHDWGINEVQRLAGKQMETERIILRLWRKEDAENLFKYASDPDVGPRAGWAPHQSAEESREIIQKYFSNDRTWAIELKETGEIIGCVGYLLPDECNISIGENDAEVGYWVAKPYWNQGICTEALRLVVNYCFNKKGFHTLWGDYFVDNPASGHVMEKCGFRETGDTSYCTHLYGGKDRLVKIMKLGRE